MNNNTENQIFTDEDIKKILWNGADRNMVVYDSQASPGSVTLKLFQLMKEIMEHPNNTKGKDVKLTHIFLLNHPEVEESKFGDVTIRNLKLGFDVNKYWDKDLKASCAPEDSNLVVGVDLRNPADVFTDTNKVLTGSY